MYNGKHFFLVLLLSGFAVTGSATVRNVPSSYGTIQSAIDSAGNGDTVIVAPGLYYENINFHGKKIIVASQFLLTRDLSDIENTIINGSQAADPDTQSVVLFISGEDTSSVLEGFTITGGKGTAWKDEHSNGTYREGGGILTAFTSPIIRYNRIVNNSATDKVGLTGAGGGGIRSGDGNPSILNNLIMMNTGHYGAGIVLNFSGGTVRNNVIYKNSGGRDFGGGGIWMNGNGSNPKLIENNTIIENSVPQNSGGGILIQSTIATARNNIIWGNTAATEPQISIAAGSMTVSYSDVQGGWTGTGNINQYPKFTDTSHYLLPSSPCIDAGNPSSVYNDPEDTLNPGSALFPSMGTLRNDMGAYGGGHRSALPYYDDHVSDPLPPSGISAFSDYSTPTTVHIQWHDPTARRDSTPLSNFKIHIYRDSALVAVVDSGVQGYDDTGLVNHQRYVYWLLTSAATDSSIVDSVVIIAGGSAYPQPPTLFSVADANDGIHLTWKNPSRQTDGTPLNDLAFVLLYRDNVLFDSVGQTSVDTGAIRSYADTITGYHQYRIAVRDNEVPVHYSTSTSVALGYGGFTNSFASDFEAGLGTSFYKVGPWDTTSHIAHGGTHSLTDSPVGDYSTLQVFYIYMPPIILQPGSVLRFDHIAIVRPTGSVLVDISRNQRKTFSAIRTYDWNSFPPWQDQSADSSDWKFEHIDLSAYAGDTAIIRFRILTGAFPADGWYIDNVYIGPSSFPITFGQDIRTGWNLISLPVQTTSHSVKDLYPSSEAHAFSFAGTYVECDTLREGIGYWLRFPSDLQVNIDGMTLVKKTVNVVKGWNVIGGLSTPLATASILSTGTTVTSQYIGYDDTSGYTGEDTLTPGKGYWVKVGSAGQLSFRTDSVLIIPKVSPTRDNANAPITKLIFRDAKDQERTLYASPYNRDIQLERYELPPLPPGNAMDVRFTSNRFLEMSDDHVRTTTSILLTSAVEPLTITWENVERNPVLSLVIDGTTIRLDKCKQIVLQHLPSKLHLVLPATSVKEFPTSFALGQNYPNPFNPSTTIHYQLPTEARVSMRIYDVLGREIQTLINDDIEEAGFKEIEWNASSMPSGVYFYRLEAKNSTAHGELFVDIKKMLLVK
jgi:hypothetical protein